VEFIPPESNADTYNLLAQCDVAVLNGGSTAIEATALGKRVVLLGMAKYAEAGFALSIQSPEELTVVSDIWDDFDATAATGRMLRFVYCQMARMPQFTKFVRAEQPTNYRYYVGGDVARLERLIVTGDLEPDDARETGSGDQEDAVVQALRSANWVALLNQAPVFTPPGPRYAVKRRFGLTWIDGARQVMKRGDRG
jgi:hypothetical protein